MEYNFKENKAFLHIIKQKQHDILKRTSQEIQESIRFKQLHSSLTTYLYKNSFRDFKAILIAKEDIEGLSDEYYNDLESLLNSDDGVLNNFIYINNKLEIVCKKRDFRCNADSNMARKHYRELSTQYVVFLLQPEKKISLFIDGEDFVEGLFLTPEDWDTYTSKRTLDELPILLEEYRNHLKDRPTYNKFFISKSHLKSLRNDLNSKLTEDDFIAEHKHLLENTPEDRFREDLRLFLVNHLKATFYSKEYILENFKRLDIIILDESGYGLFLVEVKWVGNCISKSGKAISNTSFDKEHINPAAIIQSVKYIRQLDLEGKNIKLGYLVVFDARKDQNQKDTVETFNESNLEDEYKGHYKKFRKILDFKVVNTHPS